MLVKYGLRGKTNYFTYFYLNDLTLQHQTKMTQSTIDYSKIIIIKKPFKILNKIVSCCITRKSKLAIVFRKLSI